MEESKIKHTVRKVLWKGNILRIKYHFIHFRGSAGSVDLVHKCTSYIVDTMDWRKLQDSGYVSCSVEDLVYRITKSIKSGNWCTYTNCEWPQKKKNNGLQSGEREGQPLSIHQFGNVSSRICMATKLTCSAAPSCTNQRSRRIVNRMSSRRFPSSCSKNNLSEHSENVWQNLRR